MSKKIKYNNKKINDNMDLLSNLIKFSLILLIVVSAIALIFFRDGSDLDYKGWITLVISLGGAIVGGIFTMLGVVLTLNRSITEKEELEKEKQLSKEIDKKEKLKVMSLQVYYEIDSYINSIKKYTLNVLDIKIKYGFKENVDDNKIEELCRGWIWINDIYFMADNIKDIFYKIMSNGDFEDKENLIKTFVKLNINHERTKRLFNSDERRSVEVLNNMAIDVLSDEFINYRLEVFNKINPITPKMIEYSTDEYIDIKNFKKHCREEWALFKSKNVFSEDINKLLNELKRVMELDG